MGKTSTFGRPARDVLADLLARVDVRLDGDRSWDIRTGHPQLSGRLLAHGALGLGESYMDGWWDCDQIDELVRRLLGANLNHIIRSPKELIDRLQARCMNRQCRSRAWLVGRHHYDIGDDLYRSMLDDKMLYSCAYWKNADDLNAAQEAKLELIARKLQLQAGMKVLDIGCGWGGSAWYLAKHYGVAVTGVTISRNQAAAAAELCRGLPVDIRLEDYRNLTGRFDRIFSVGMFEHVGYKNHKPFIRIVRDLLVEDGIFLLHTIGNNREAINTDPWIERYIFPGSTIPSANQIVNACKGLFILEDWHNFGVDYDKTLMHWHRNFEAVWPQLAPSYDERFYRMWRYYLLSCAGSFRARKNQLWQLVLSPAGLKNGYQSVR